MTLSWPRPWSAARVAAAGGAWLLLFDFDGTLSPTVPQPDLARLPDRMRRVLTGLVGMPACRVGVVSGRGLEDLRNRADVPGLLLAGSGGLEWEIDGVRGAVSEAAAGMKTVAAVTAALAGRLARVPGVWLERKPLGLTIHHRAADGESVATVRGLAAELQAVHGADLRVVACALGVEITPCPAHHKGSAVRMLVAALGGEPMHVVYAGNDANDAEAMAEVARRGGWTLAVGPDAPPADQRLDGPEALAAWLEALAATLRCQSTPALGRSV